MSEQLDYADIAPGTPVFDAMNVALGTVESSDKTTFRVQGQDFPLSAIARADSAGIHLHLARTALDVASRVEGTGQTNATPEEGQIVIPLAEERLTVSTREIDLGEIIIRKRIVEEERMIPVVFRREEVEILRRGPGETWSVEDPPPGTEITRIPIQAWEPVIGKEAIVGREVVIDKARLAEEGQVTGTVRREHATIEEQYAQARPDLEREFMAGSESTGRTFVEAEPQYREGFIAGSDQRYAGHRFEDVEPDLRQQRGEVADQPGAWETLRREIRAGFEAARRR